MSVVYAAIVQFYTTDGTELSFYVYVGEKEEDKGWWCGSTVCYGILGGAFESQLYVQWTQCTQYM